MSRLPTYSTSGRPTSNRLRWLGTALLIVAVASGVVVTGSTTTTTADRSLSVAVADDTDAYVAIDDCTVRNQHQTPLLVEISYNGTTETARLAPGEQYRIDATGPVELTVIESSGAVETQLTYEGPCTDR